MFSNLGTAPLRLAIYLATVVCPISMPSLRSSPWIRGAPHSGLATLISRISRRISSGKVGRPPRSRPPTPVRSGPGAVPTDPIRFATETPCRRNSSALKLGRVKRLERVDIADGLRLLVPFEIAQRNVFGCEVRQKEAV